MTPKRLHGDWNWVELSEGPEHYDDRSGLAHDLLSTVEVLCPRAIGPVL